MSYADGHWYTSSVFWGPAAGVIAVVLIGAITLWVTYRLTYPKRRLFYGISSDTTLLRKRSITGVEVRYGGKPLASPRVVTVQIRNAGRRDITREAFDGTPLELDVDQDIVDCLDVATKPDDQPRPQVKTRESVLAIEPVKIGKGETISIDLLTDGERPELRKPTQTLIDVDMRPQPEGERSLLPYWIIAGALLPVLAFLVLTTIVNNQTTNSSASVAGVAGVAAATAVMLAQTASWLRRR